MNTTLGDVPFPAGSEGLCFPFYGEFSKADVKDCVKALSLMDPSETKQTYSVDRGRGDYQIPLYRQSGKCLIQVEMAGQSVPQTIDIAPAEIKDIATIIYEQCIQGKPLKEKTGGFWTGDTTPLKTYVQEQAFAFNKPYPQETAFLTVSITHRVPDWLAPGKFDPILAFILADTELKASGKVGGAKTAQGKELIKRSRKFYEQGRRMEPRGQRIEWYNVEMFDSNGIPSNSSNVLSTDWENTASTTPNTATAKRRRRGL